MLPETLTGKDTDRIAVVGGREATGLFQAAGLRVFPVEPGPDVTEQVQNLVAQGYRVIFFTEELRSFVEPVLDRFRKSPVPCIIALPAVEPTEDARRSIARLKEVVRRAVGIDIFSTDRAGIGDRG